MAITTSNSINVKPLVLFVFILVSCLCPVLPSDHSPGPVKSQTQIPIPQPVNLRRLQRHYAHCPPLVTGPDQRSARRDARVGNPLGPPHAAREFRFPSRLAQFRDCLFVTELADSPIPINLLQRLTPDPKQAKQRSANQPGCMGSHRRHIGRTYPLAVGLQPVKNGQIS
jgi:hypothetical protein